MNFSPNISITVCDTYFNEVSSYEKKSKKDEEIVVNPETVELKKRVSPKIVHRSLSINNDKWEIIEDGCVCVTDEYFDKIQAKWLTSKITIPVGEYIPPRSWSDRDSVFREGSLQFMVVNGVIQKWRLVHLKGKGIHWRSGFNWLKITANAAENRIRLNCPYPEQYSQDFSPEKFDSIMQKTAELLREAKKSADSSAWGKEIVDDDWDTLRIGWSDRFKSEDYHRTVCIIRGQLKKTLK